MSFTGRVVGGDDARRQRLLAFPGFGSWGDYCAGGVCTESLVAGDGEDLNPDRRVEEKVDEACGPCLGEVVHRAWPGLAAEQPDAYLGGVHQGLRVVAQVGHHVAQ